MTASLRLITDTNLAFGTAAYFTFVLAKNTITTIMRD